MQDEILFSTEFHFFVTRWRKHKLRPNMNRINYHSDDDVEATDDELKSVCYTAVSFVGLVIILIGSFIYIFF
jgi:hypothetical protein